MVAYLPPILPPRRPQELVLTVREANSSGDRRQVTGVARQVYRNDDRWVPLFSAARRQALLPGRNPLLEGGDVAAFIGIARNLGLGDETVGTVAAWTAKEADDKGTGAWGHWGFFEAVNVRDLADQLFYAAETWLFEHASGLQGIRGPASIEPLLSPGLLVDGFDMRPLAHLPYNPPYYPEMVEAQDYEPGLAWKVHTLDLPSTAGLSGPTGPVRILAGADLLGAWPMLARAYHDTPSDATYIATLVPGLAGWLGDLAGAARLPVHPSWRWAVHPAFQRAIAVVADDDTGAVAACFGVPDAGDALRMIRGRLLPVGWAAYRWAVNRSRRFRVFPARVPSSWDAGQLATLYRALAQAAAVKGYWQIDVAPIAEEDERSTEALARLGAHATQRFVIYEKGF